MRKILNFMNRGGAKRLPLSKFNMFGLGKWMMVKLMKDAKTPSLDEMIELAASMGVKFMACTTSMGMMGVSKEALIPQVNSYCGVATYLSEARDSKINLFI